MLDRWAKLNIEMDSLAKVYWNDMVDLQHEYNPPIAYEYWPLSIRGQKVSSRLDVKIREHILGNAQCTRWEKKGRLSNECIQKVNWQACEKAMRSLSLGR